jgi:hypothetical protein
MADPTPISARPRTTVPQGSPPVRGRLLGSAEVATASTLGAPAADVVDPVGPAPAVVDGPDEPDDDEDDEDDEPELDDVELVGLEVGAGTATTAP